MISHGDNGGNGEEENQHDTNGQSQIRNALFAAFEEDALTRGDQTGENGVNTEQNLNERKGRTFRSRDSLTSLSNTGRTPCGWFA